MEEVRVIKVTGSEQMNDFIQLPKKIYRNIPQYVPEFESDVRGLFDIKTNPGLEFSKIQPFVAYRGGTRRAHRGHREQKGQQEMESQEREVLDD